MKKTSLFIMAVLLVAAVSALGQTHGDYRSAASGNWGTAATWETYDTVSTSWVAASVQPTSANNVTIQTGDTVIVEASPKNCLDLTIEANAKLYANSTSNRYINIYGSTITNNGLMGGGTDGLCITACYAADLLFQGSGTTDISRLRPASGQNGRTMTIDMDILLRFAGASLYCNSSSSMTFNINTGKTVSFGPGSFFAYGTNGATATTGMGNAVVNIDGNMIMYNGSNFNVSVTTGNTSTVNISGLLSAGDSIMANGTGSEVFNINTGGQLLFPNTDTLTFLDSLNFFDPSGLSLTYPITVAGKLGLMSGVIDSAQYIKMLDNSTIQRTTGRLNQAPIFGNTINLIYYGAAACTTGYEMPTTDIVQKLAVNNPGGLTMDETVMVNDTLFLTDGVIRVIGDNYLGAAGAVDRTTGYVIGMMGRVVEAGANINKAFDIGTASGYSPVTLDFNVVAKQGLMSVKTVASTAPGVTTPENCMLRYWELGMRPDSLITFGSYSLTLNYLPFDFNTGFIESTDEPGMVAGRYDSAWTFPVIGTRNPGGAADGGSVVLDSLTAFDIFTLAKDQDAIYTFSDTIAPYITGVSPAWGATGVGLNDTIVIAFSEPMNTDSLDGFTDPFHDFTPSWNAAGDTFTLVPQDPYPYSTVMSVIITAGKDLAGNSMAILPDTVVQFTTAPFQGPSITLVQQPEDTYDGTGPFPVRAVITDLGKAGIAADTLWYTDNATDWWAMVHSSTDGDTFNYSIPGPLAAGTVIEFFFGAWDDGGTVQYDPSMYRGYQFRILDPLAPTGLAANGGNLTVDLSWAPPAEVIDYSNSNATGFFWDAGDIISTRFTPQHYPCKVEQVVSSWWNAIGIDSVEVHVWADDGAGLPDRSVELVPPRVVLPLDYPNYTVIDISSENLILSSGDFHVGYVIRTDNYPMPTCDSDGPGIRSLVYDSSATTWGNMIDGSNNYHDWSHQAAVTYHNYSKGLALKSYVPKPGDKSLPKLADIKTAMIATKQTPVYPSLMGALFLAKNITGYDLMRSDVSGGPYAELAKINDTTYTDNTVLNNNTYYYVVRALYASPDTFSDYSNQASATPTGVEGRPESRAYVLQLRAAAPNPMTTGTAIRFSLPASAQASLEVFNVLGQKVTTLANGKLDAGHHTANWDGTDRHGAKLASGVYIYQLRTMNKTLTKRITILR
ncbi:MAG: hypothetical protein A2509_11815 [Candidatus Edwardsbacteria bacterium RIFOXYD12_FULL_50_11]|nr:MAG: hypothetical protein A2502_04240 [Candidatus Edwardsbacteria bacterium RifOxyC12_full_54_24]OGF08607.1 MAG: hypothetical protein A2273_06620 [Candidatus Edwardsbacteria bacterium RifOxyA12_full_54_48]OGF11251.1 MAG: hypothetical protein A3K15_02685 [Candidatus Edwardsbacteria bacterium GWE2_54_12]OGF16807.1 MAG: hypothetical protein A2509_11815 [Candidatus Edwardsbacteria bacterium RIFOXYD12_FULL_50_11]OGJ18065.1 MAG: hypothetical protein A2349_05075 [Candidatus Edwardsbacteria bacteriu